MLNDTQIKSAKILVIDDELVNVELVKEMLDISGYSNITGVSDPEQGLELYRDQDFDLVLLDILMPKMDGFEVMTRMKQLGKAVPPPILVLTALSDLRIRLKALDQGARDFLSKPFEIDEAVCRIFNLLEMHLAQKQLSQYNDRLKKEVEKATFELQKTQLEIVHRLGAAAEYRDTETGAHTLRVGYYTECLAKALGYADSAADLLLHAAPMHDIGKIGIPDSVLLKRGKLDAQEWSIMKSHTTIGAEILSGDTSQVMQMARVIAFSHHEKWNGSGYPEGLSGKDIPMEGHIVSVADVFDALTMVRPYKRAWSVDEAVNFIQEGSGRDFSPKLVTAFLDHLPDITAIRERYSDD